MKNERTCAGSDLIGRSEFVRRSECPVCRVERGQIVGSVSPEMNVVIAGENYTQPVSCIIECDNCGLLYRDCIFNERMLSRYYSETAFQKWEIAGLFPTERTVIDQLKRLPHRSKILDFGCSTGRLLANLVAEYDCYGCEVNVVAASEASKKGIKVIKNCDLRLLSKGWFDAVVMVDVFEHFDDPLAEIKQLFNILKPGGSLLIVTGNGDNASCRLDPAQFWYLCNVEHLCMITRKHAEYMAGVIGAKIGYWEEVCHYEHSLFVRLKQECQHFVYWQFRRRTLLSRFVLSFIPVIRRAISWRCAPAYSCTQDHVVFSFEKP